jgi:CheY-like chemotaxis protein
MVEDDYAVRSPFKHHIEQFLPMASTKVLSIGQCRPDSAAIQHYLQSTFGSEVITADTADAALRLLQDQRFDLVLINRILDADYSSGMDILKSIRLNEAWDTLPVMLVSNYPEWQQAAIAAGALPGFGKAELNRAETREKLSAVLGGG